MATPLPAELTKLKEDITDTYFGHNCGVYTNSDFSSIYADQVNSSWDLNEKPEEQFAEIDFLNKNNIKLSKIFLNSISDILFCLSDDARVYSYGDGSESQLGLGEKSTTLRIAKYNCNLMIMGQILSLSKKCYLEPQTLPDDF